MTKKIRHQGAELEVYPTNTPIIWGAAGLHDLQNRKGETFVRRVRFRSPGHNSLGEALEKADADFKNVAGRVGAQIVSHQWGIYPVRNNNNRYFLGSQEKINQNHPDLLPDRHILVAEVELLRDVRKLSPGQKDLIRTACARFDDEVAPGEPYWSEAIPAQFTTICPAAGRKTGWPLILTDVEPIMDIKPK